MQLTPMFRAFAAGLAALALAGTVYAAGKNQPPTVTLTSPASNASFGLGASVPLAANAQDSDGTVGKVEFFAGTQLVATRTAAPYTATWIPSAAGTYSITAKATDNGNASTTSTAATITVLPNTPPTVSIVAPSSGAGFQAPATIAISANASDPDGSIARVEFYQGASLLGSVTTAPYTFNWVGVGPGGYLLTAKAVDNQDGQATSDAVSVGVGNPPLVVLKQPDDCATFTLPANIALAADAVDLFGWIVRVDFYANGNLVGTATRKPYTATWNAVPEGSYTLLARATNHLGLTADSVPVEITAEPPNTPSTVQITEPAAGSSFRVGNTVTVTASATDPDGIAQVIFKESGSTIASTTGSGPTYSVQWSPATPGSPQLTATVIDNRNASTISNAVTVTVVANASPTASLTAPANNSSHREGAAIPFAATASDSDGSVSQVEVLLDGAVSSTIAGPGPYSGELAGVAVGSHGIQLRPRDNDGATGLSGTVNVTVVANALPTVQITAPANNATFDAPANVAITATASDSDGTIAKVEFFANGALVAISTAPPYTATWTNAALGAHVLTAKATDNDGGARTSAPVSITVNGITAAITAPADGASYVAPASFEVRATASTTSDGITSVELRDGATSLSTIQVPPGNSTANVTYSLTAVGAGAHAYTVVARDGGGRSATSDAVTVNVAPPPTPPSVTLTSPQANVFYVEPATIRLRANAAAGSHPVARVEFLSGSTVVGTATSSPYAFDWNNVPAGSYSLSARAVDTAGGSANSAAVPVTVGTLNLSIDFPANGASISGNEVMVSGTIQASTNSGVTVNGAVAAIGADNRFHALVPLSVGSNTITATVTTPAAQSATQSIGVSAAGVSSPVTIGITPLEGVAPLTVDVTIFNGAASNVVVRVNGSTAGTLPPGQGTSFNLSYSAAGSFALSVTGTDTQGTVTAKDVVVVAQDEARLDAMLRGIWSGMTDALLARDKATALSYLSLSAKDRYGPVFDALAPDMPQILATWSAPLKGKVSGDVAEYAIATPEGSARRLFLIYLIRGSDGIWRLESM